MILLTLADDRQSGSRQSFRNTTGKTRKERRKQERQQKKQSQSNGRSEDHSTRDEQSSRRQVRRNGNESESSVTDISDTEPEIIPPRKPAVEKVSVLETKEPAPKKEKEKSKKVEKAPGTAPPVLRKAVADALDDDDAEIAALEKKLKLKKGKLSKGFEEDNLDWLLEGLNPENDEKQKDRRYLAEKRGMKRKRDNLDGDRLHENGDVEITPPADDDNSDKTGGDIPDSDIDSDDYDQDEEMDDGEIGYNEDHVWSGFSSDDESIDDADVQVSVAKYEEAKNEASSLQMATNPRQPTKYIPPAQRRQLMVSNGDGDSADLDVLRKKIQGQVNRLTETSMLGIVKAIEDIYRDHPRQLVTATLTAKVLDSISNEVNTRDTFFTLYGGFIAALYRILGTDFGAYFLQNVVELFDRCYFEASEDKENSDLPGKKKQALDLMSLLAELYNLGVVGAALIFDFIRIFVSQVSELNAELLLKIVRSSGPQLRQDDPSALKDIVSMLNSSIAKHGTEDLSVRFKFMIETLTNLKNNKARKGNDASIVASEAIVRMKKILGTLNTRQLRASEPLRPSLRDIRDVDKKGKWWLVGASWRHNMVDDAEEQNESAQKAAQNIDDDDIDDGITNYLQLAREQRMNTDVRRAIFVAIMSSEDYRDARERLLKLRLKRNQEREIPHVLLHCCGNEAQYNPYYTLIAQQLCSQHSIRMAFQFSLWEQFRRMGEEDTFGNGNPEFEEDDEDERMPLRKIVNLAKMYGYLIAHGLLPVTVLKVSCPCCTIALPSI